MSAELVAWVSSGVLVLTMARELRVRSPHGHAASPWLFGGQLVAATGLVVQGLFFGSVALTVSSALLTASALAGFILAQREPRLALVKVPEPGSASRRTPAVRTPSSREGGRLVALPTPPRARQILPDRQTEARTSQIVTRKVAGAGSARGPDEADKGREAPRALDDDPGKLNPVDEHARDPFAD